MIALGAASLLAPPPRVVSREWLPESVTMPKGTETGSLPFSLSAFPHCDGPLDAFDNPAIRRVILQWGTRLGKTTLCLSLMAKTAVTNPRNMMFSSSTQGAAVRVIGERLWPILAATKGLTLPPEVRRSNMCVRLQGCRVYVGWSGSAASLADVGAFFGVANEIDKWDTSASDEADPLKLFVNRTKGFPDHKIILESTPTIKGRSRIEGLLLDSNQHLRHVPCPKCGEFQVLRKGVQGRPGGFWWWHDGDGKSDPEIAYETAVYICQFCEHRIQNHERTPMLRKGVWCPTDCTVNIYGEIVGENERQASDTIGFGPLPSWYALTETWGSFPRMWLSAQGKPRELQDVVNSYMAETWEQRPSKSRPDEVGKRLSTDSPRGVVPEWGRFLTVTVDQQAAEGGYRLFVVMAHGENERAMVIDIGWTRTLAELWEPQMRRHFQHLDGGNSIQPDIAAVDSGWDTKETYDFCNSHPGVWALKGSAGDIKGRAYRVGEVKEGENRGQFLFEVNTDFWETELQARLDNRRPGEPGALELCDGLGKDRFFLDQLCNMMISDKIDRRGNAVRLWVKRHTSQPNDYRDAVRYGLALGRAWVEENGGLPDRSSIKTQKPMIVNHGDKRPDGRAWV